MTGETFGSVTVIAGCGRDHNCRSLWLGRCVCGVEEVFSQQRLAHQKNVQCSVCVRNRRQEHGRAISKIRRPDAQPASMRLDSSEIQVLRTIAEARRRSSSRVRRKFRFAMLPAEKAALDANARRFDLPTATLVTSSLERAGLLDASISSSAIELLSKTAARRSRGKYNNLQNASLSLGDAEWQSLDDMAAQLSVPLSRLVLAAVERLGLMTKLRQIDWAKELEEADARQESRVDMACRLGVHPTTVTRAADSLGLPRVYRTHWRKDERKWRRLLHKHRHLTVNEFARMHDLNYKTVRSMQSAIGIELAPCPHGASIRKAGETDWAVELARARELGLSHRRLALELGCSPSAVYRAASRFYSEEG